MRKPVAFVLAVGLAGAIFSSVSSAPAAVLDFGPEEIVQADGSDLQVLGYSVPWCADLNDDGLMDLMVGEGGGGFSGKVRAYLNDAISGRPQLSEFSYVQAGGTDLVVPPGGCLGAFPRTANIDGDDKLDLLIGLGNGTVKAYLNIGTSGALAFDAGRLLEFGPAGGKVPIDVGDRATLAVTDFDNNGLEDLVVGAYDGRIRLYLNEGSSAAPDFARAMILQNDTADLFVPSLRSSPVVRDLTGDGKKDLLVGNTNGQILLYANQGADGNPAFTTHVHVTADGAAIDLLGTARSRPSLADWTGNGRPDLLVGSKDGKVRLYQNVPEPASLAMLLGTASALLLWLRRR